ncbi:MAG TPA: STAS domain-containing protein [Anaeromyxobacter sp.]
MLRDRTAEGSLTLKLGQAFAPEDAARIHELIERAEPGTPIDIDFHRVRECEDFALALLAKDIAGGRASVAIHGTSKHQQRMLEYFGVAAGRPPPGDAEIV